MLYLFILIPYNALAQKIPVNLQSDFAIFDDNQTCQNPTLCSNLDLHALNTHLKSLCQELLAQGIGYTNVGSCMADQKSSYNQIHNAKTSYNRITTGEYDPQHEYFEAYMKNLEQCKPTYKTGYKGYYGYKAVDDCAEEGIDEV